MIIQTITSHDSGVGATIHITAPSGSTVTFDSKVLTEHPIIGQTVSEYITTVFEYGSYEVVATLDGKTVSTTIDVRTSEDYYAELSFQQYHTTYLYYLGDECMDVTGGWTTYGTNGSKQKNSNNLQITQNAQSGATNVWATGFYTANNIDRTPYTGAVMAATQSGNYGVNTSMSSYEYIPSSSHPSPLASTVVAYNARISVKTPTSLSYNNKHIVTEVRASSGSVTSNIYGFALFKSDNISGLSAYGSTIAQIINNASSLLANRDAVYYMLNYCTGDFMWTALSTASFVTALRASQYFGTISTNEEWGKAIALL